MASTSNDVLHISFCPSWVWRKKKLIRPCSDRPAWFMQIMQIQAFLTSIKIPMYCQLTSLAIRNQYCISISNILGMIHKISLIILSSKCILSQSLRKSIHNFLRSPADGQKDRWTNFKHLLTPLLCTDNSR